MSDEKYSKLRSTLRGLPRINTRSDFEQKLFQRVRLVDNETLAKQLSDKYAHKKAGWYINLFRPSLAPALGLAAGVLAAIVVLFLMLTPTGDAPIGDSSDNQPNPVQQQNSSSGFLKGTDIAKLEQKSKEVQSLPNATDGNIRDSREKLVTPPEIHTDRDVKIETGITPPPVRIEEKMMEEQRAIEPNFETTTTPKSEGVTDDKRKAEETIVPEKKETKKNSDTNNEQRISKETFPFGKVSVLPKDSIADTTKISRSRRSENKGDETEEQK